MPFRILFAEQNPIAQIGIEALCKKHNCSIDRIVSSMSEMKRSLNEEHFDVVVSDARVGYEDFIQEAIPIKQQLRDMKIILYTHFDNPTVVAQAVAYGFYDVVMRHSSGEKLIQSLRSLEQGSPPEYSLLRKFRTYMTQDNWPILPSAQRLTRREVQIVALLGLGLSNREISQSLKISLETAKEHVQNVLRKLNVSDRTAAAVWAIRHGGRTLGLPSLTSMQQSEHP